MHPSQAPPLLRNLRPRYPILFCYNLFYKYAELYGAIHSHRAQLLQDQGFQAFQVCNRTHSQQTISKRAEMFADKIHKVKRPTHPQVLRVTGAQKCHVIGHSFAGVDLRCLAGIHGGHQFLASVTTIASPNTGFKMGELLREKEKECRYERIYRHFYLLGLTPENASQFNSQNLFEMNSLCHHQGEDTPVGSIGAVTEYPQFIYRDNVFLFNGEHPNDGIVCAEETPIGTHLGTFNMDHVQVVGLAPDYDGAPAVNLAANFAKAVEVKTDPEQRLKVEL